MDGVLMGLWLDGWMNERVDGQTDECTDGLTYDMMDKPVEVSWKDGWMNRWMDG